MPAPIILEDQSGLAPAVSAFTQALSGNIAGQYQEEKERQKKLQQQAETRTWMKNTQEKLQQAQTPLEKMSILQEASSQLPADQAKNVMDFYQPYLKEEFKGERTKNLLDYILSDGQGMGQPQDTLSPFQNAVGQTDMAAAQQPSPREQNLVKSFENLPEEKLLAMKATGNQELGNIADYVMDKRKEERRRFEGERTYQAGFGKDVVKKMSAEREKLRNKKFASTMARDAIESDETGAFSWANIAERFGIPELQSAKGAQLALAAKINVVGNLADISARAQNMWIEQQMKAAFPQAANSKHAAATTLEFFDAEVDITENILREKEKIIEEDKTKNNGIVEWDTLEARAERRAEPLNVERMNQAGFKARQHYEAEKGEGWLIDNAMKKVPSGTFLTPKMAAVFKYKFDGNSKKAIENAKKLGYSIPTKDQKNQWQ